MCGVIPKLLIDPAWPDAALDRVGDLLSTVRCPLLGPDQPAIPLAFTQGGKAVTVQWECWRLVAKPITPDLFALDIVQHVCRPVKLTRGWQLRAVRAGAVVREIDGVSVIEDAVHYGTPCGFPPSFARAFLASRRVEWLPMLWSGGSWEPNSRLLPEWNLFRDRIVEIPSPVPTAVAMPVAAQPAAAPQLPLPEAH